MTDRATSVPEWLRSLSSAHSLRCGPSCLGTVEHIDASARRRGASEVRSGKSLSLGRLVNDGVLARYDDQRRSFEIELYEFVDDNGILIGTDRVEFDAHGLENTHIDAPGHIGVGGTWHGGLPADSVHSAGDGLVAWAAHGLMTRAFMIDIPAERGSDWVSVDRPVSGAELDRYITSHRIQLEPGDAILLYMGRDRYEAAGFELLPSGLSPGGRPGIDRSGAIWLADQRIGLLCWDFLDALNSAERGMSVHMLIWAIGLALVDNCDLGPAARAMSELGRVSSLLYIAPLAIPGATGSLVNPTLVL